MGHYYSEMGDVEGDTRRRAKRQDDLLRGITMAVEEQGAARVIFELLNRLNGVAAYSPKGYFRDIAEGTRNPDGSIKE